MKVSIIIPTYNNGNCVCQSLETWSNQSLQSLEYEVIIVDNNSNDKTEDIIKQFIIDKANFKYIKETRVGSTAARHAGAKIANAKYLIFADDDGLFNKNCIDEILKVYHSNPDIDAVTGKIDILWDSSPPDWIHPYEFMLGKLNYGDNIVYGKDLFLNGGLFSIKKDVFNKLKGFNPDLIDGHLIGDGDTGLVNKLHENNCLIGYTPFAVMKHLQNVNKHGTVSDLGRRFFNVGISNTYSFFKKNQFNYNSNVFKYFIFKSLLLLKKNVELQFDRENKKKYFSLMERRGEIQFFLNLFNKEIRQSIKAEA